MPIIGPAYDALYAVLSHLFRQIVDESYFARWQKTETENTQLKIENMELKARLSQRRSTPSRQDFFVERPTLLPLWQGADSPV